MDKEDKKSCAANLKSALEIFTTDVDKLHKNGKLSIEQEFLKKIAEDVNRLYASSIQAQKAEDEEIEEIGSIIQGIFDQPIAIKHHEHMNIVQAVKTFKPGKSEDCNLSFIMREYVKHPASTKSFLIELGLLSDHLNNALHHIA